MTLSRKVAGLDSGPLLASAPIVDGATGLHSEDCACARCQLGYGPTREERHQARMRLQRAAARAKAAVEASAVLARKRAAAEVTAALLKLDETDTKERMKVALAPVIRPATAKELDELKREFGLERKRGMR